MNAVDFDRSLVDLLPISTVIIAQGKIVFASQAAVELLEVADENALLGRPIAEYIHSVDQSRSQQRLNKTPGSWQNPPARFRIRTSRDQYKQVMVASRSIRFNGADAVILSGMDITQQNEMAQHLRQSDMDFRRLFENMEDVYFRTGHDGRILRVSPAVKRMFGYSTQEVEGHPVWDFYQIDQHAEDFKSAILRDGRVSDYPARLRSKDGRMVEVSVNARVLLGDRGEFLGVEGIFRDVTERNVMERELQRLATTDPLTGISNRRAFLERAQHILKSSQRYQNPMSVLMLDLDFFKTVNDRYGHLSGDLVLRQFAEAVQSELREIDVFGRLGGEEFCVVLQQTQQAAAVQAAERIRQRIENLPLKSDKQQSIQLTVSIGASCLRPGEEQLEQLLDRADQALYRAKQEGRNRVVWLA